MPDEIRRLIGYKPSPIQVHSMDLRLSCGAGDSTWLHVVIV